MISVIVPIYRVEKYLSRCIESILNQSYKDIEVFLVDDGSPDNCGEICDRYARKDNRITVIHQKNAGVSAARNAGLNRAKGEYIGFVDPDDYIAVDMYDKMLTSLEKERANLAICGYNYIDESGNIDEKRIYQLAKNELITQKQLMSRFSDMPPTVRLGVVNKLFSREKLGQLRFQENLHSAEDVLFITEYAKTVKKAVFVHEPLYLNTVREGSATHGGLNIESLADSFDIHERMYQTVVSIYPELKDHSLAFLLDVCLLKYNEALSRLTEMPQKEQDAVALRVKEMKRCVRRWAWRSLNNSEIYWKTKISYLIK